MAILPPTPESDEAKELLLANRKCVAFLGAGITIPPGGTWKGLVGEVAARCNVHFDKKTQTTEYPTVIDRCISADENGCNEVLRVSLAKHVVSSRTALTDIHRLELKSIVTTNFDPWVGDRSRHSHYNNGIHVYPDLPLHLGSSGSIYYLHGKFSSEDPRASISKLIFGQQSFVEAYENSPLLPGFLLNLFIYENIVFIGFNPTEKYVSELLRKSIAVRLAIQAASVTGNTTKRFLLTPMPRGKSAAQRAREAAYITNVRALDITPVFYDNSTGDHVGIEELLSKWIAESQLEDRPALFKTGFDD